MEKPRGEVFRGCLSRGWQREIGLFPKKIDIFQKKEKKSENVGDGCS